VFLTVTLNAAIDKSLRVANLQIGYRHRCQPGLVQPGGKGINVARALKILGQPVIATGLAGGRTGQRIVEALTGESILNDFVQIADESRTTTLIVDATGEGAPTEIVEYGPEVEPEELSLLMAKLDYLMRGASTVVFAGSLPRRVPEEWYAQAVREARKQKLFTVLDSEGQPLRRGLAAEPDLVSPNQQEAEELVGFEFQTDQDFVVALDDIAEMGARNVIITRESGCFALLREGPRVQRLVAETELLKRISTVGSGDALLAGFLAARRAERSLEDSLRHAVACGAANTQSVGAGMFDPRDANRLTASVTVSELERVAT
jgi:1-phosphofructokinase/tagatose 6-phosphate kinase